MSPKAQVVYLDFVIALLIFIFTLAVYFSYTNNFQKQNKGNLDLMVEHAIAVSNSLVLEGYPNDWDNSTAVRIGIADNQQLNATKLVKLKEFNYGLSKRKLATSYDYFVYFVNDRNEVINVKGVCGTGHPLINTTYNIKSAYYYQDEDDSFLKNFMINSFDADVYFDDEIDNLINNLNEYGLIVLEHPAFTPSELDDYYRPFNNYTARGGFFLVSGELTTSSSGLDLNGIVFDKKTGTSSQEEIAIVNNTDQYLIFSVGDAIQFDQYFFVENDTSPPIETNPNDDEYNPNPAVDFKRIATFNQTDDKAIAKWKYGNGTVYFFSDFNADYFNGNFIRVVEDLTLSFIEGTCNPINLTAINPKSLAKAERYLIYNSKLAKMVVYIWE